MDLTANKVLTYKSTQFPEPQSAPYACSWDVKVSRNCRRGRVTLSVDSRSRLPDEPRCSRGYLRVSPFMKEAKYDFIFKSIYFFLEFSTKFLK